VGLNRRRKDQKRKRRYVKKNCYGKLRKAIKIRTIKNVKKYGN